MNRATVALIATVVALAGAATAAARSPEQSQKTDPAAKVHAGPKLIALFHTPGKKPS